MTHLLVQSRNDSEHEGTPQTDSLRDSLVNHTLIMIAQEVAELLKQAYPVQADNVRAHRTQTTFATQTTILKRSGAARLLGCALTCT
jgi:hypothetical protein